MILKFIIIIVNILKIGSINTDGFPHKAAYKFYLCCQSFFLFISLLRKTCRRLTKTSQASCFPYHKKTVFISNWDHDIRILESRLHRLRNVCDSSFISFCSFMDSGTPIIKIMIMDFGVHFGRDFTLCAFWMRSEGLNEISGLSGYEKHFHWMWSAGLCFLDTKRVTKIFVLIVEFHRDARKSVWAWVIPKQWFGRWGPLGWHRVPEKISITNPLVTQKKSWRWTIKTSPGT